jgi:hypothetical protein
VRALPSDGQSASEAAAAALDKATAAASEAAAKAKETAKDAASKIKGAINQATLDVDISKLREWTPGTRRRPGARGAARGQRQAGRGLWPARLARGRRLAHSRAALQGGLARPRARPPCPTGSPLGPTAASCGTLHRPFLVPRPRLPAHPCPPPSRPPPPLSRPAVQYNFLVQLGLTAVSWAVVFLTSHVGIAKGAGLNPVTVILMIGVALAGYSTYLSFEYLSKSKKEGLGSLDGWDMLNKFYEHAT